MLEAEVLGKLLLMQSELAKLPDQRSILSFITEGLRCIPGVEEIAYSEDEEPTDDQQFMVQIHLRTLESKKNRLQIKITNQEAFAPYHPYLQNFICMVDLILARHSQPNRNDVLPQAAELQADERTEHQKQESERRKEKEETLIQSEDLFRTSFENTNIGVCMIMPNGRFMKVNRAFCKMMGYTSDELLTKTFNDIAHPDDKEMGTVLFVNLNKGKLDTSNFEKRYIRKDGQVVVASVSTAIARNENNETKYLISHLRDITEQKQVQKLLQESELKYRMVFENMINGFSINKIIYNEFGEAEDYIYLEVNPSYEKTMKVKSADIVGKTYKEINQEVEQEWLELCGRVAQTGAPATSNEYNKKLHKHFNTWVFCTGLDQFAVLYQDITESVSAQHEIAVNQQKLKEQNEEYETLNEELSERNGELIRAKEKAEESDRLKSAFLANMSHEIRTPMNGIIGFSDMINIPDISDQKRKFYAEIIKSSSHQLLNIVNDIVDISKIEAGIVEVNSNELNLNDLMLDLFSFYKPATQKNNINLYLNKGLNDEDAQIISDETKLRQIMNNLISNALKFTHEGHVKFGYTLKKEFIEFFVEDTGIGIPIDQQELVFDRFRQAKRDEIHNYGGTGLGLAIAKAFVSKLYGQLSLYSKPGKGTTFYFTIPYLPVNTKQQNTSTVELKNDAATILVVEDEVINYLYFEEVLTQLGLNILHAKDGAETISLMRQENKIDMIFMDIKLPDTNGFTLTSKVRTLRPGIPVVAQTAYASNGDRERAMQAGCIDYMSKPIIKSKLTEMIDRYIVKKQL